MTKDAGHDEFMNSFTPHIKERIAKTWMYITQPQDGMDFDTSVVPEAMEDKLAIMKVQAMKKYIPDPNSKILQVGAGDGLETKLFMDVGFKNITGLTVGKGNIKRAKELYGIDLHYQDMHFTKFPTGSFDAVVGFQVIEHSAAPIIAMLEFSRLFKPHGKVILDVPSHDHWTLMDNNPHHLLVLTEKQGVSLLVKAGFSDAFALPGENIGLLFIGTKDVPNSCEDHYKHLADGELF